MSFSTFNTSVFDACAFRAGSSSSSALTIREAVAAWLNSSSSLTSIVGNNIFVADPDQLSLYPCLVYTIPTRSYGHNLDGSDNTSLATVELTAMALQQSQCVAVAESIRSFAQGFRGFQSGVAILRCLLTDEADDTTPPPDASDNWIYQITLEYEVLHRTPTPSLVTQTAC